MLKNKLYVLSIFASVIFSQNIWGGHSVSTSDNLDAFSLNPAGFGLDRGSQTGLYIPTNDNGFEAFFSQRYSNFGYLVKYSDSQPDEMNWWEPLNYKVGLGFKAGRNNYIGFLWDGTTSFENSIEKTENNFVVGALLRPFNFLSIGGTYSFNEDQNISSNRFGVAIRPFSNHKITFGTDYQMISDSNLGYLNTIHPFIDFKLVDGVNVGFSTEINADHSSIDPKYQLNLGFNFDTGGAYAISDDNNNTGIGLYSSDQILPSTFNKKKKGNKKYIRMKLSGQFIEEKPGRATFVNQILFPSSRATQLRGWLEQMQEYTDNPDIDGMIIDLGGVGGGFAKKNEMRRALQDFKNAGKEIIIYSEYGISGSNYFLVSMADKIFISGSTGIDLKGFNVEVSFYRALLDTLSIVPEVFRVNYDGKSYKTAGDSFLNREMSDEMRENYTDLFQSLYNVLIKGISEGRGWTTDKTEEVINNGPYMMLSNAKSVGLIDSVMFKDQFEKYVKDLNDGKNTVIKVANLNQAEDYVNDWVTEEKEKIAVIYAVGGIMPGKSNPGPSGSSVMGDKTIMKAIKSARENKSIKAIVLRIDSGGGSVLASDNMWREIYKTTTEDSTNVKPFIASMSDVAASGGYYIAMEADSILADEATITGSIGVIGLRMNFSKLMKRIGINTSSITFGDNADFATGSRLVTDKERERIQESINESYTKFKDQIVSGRKDIWNSDSDSSTTFDLDPIAMGRVFTGDDASKLELFLVDKLGGIYDAIETAKNAAGIKGDVEIIEYPQNNNSFSFSFGVDMSAAAKDQFMDSLPEEIAKHYEFAELMKVLSADEKQMIIPYKIEVK